MDIDLTLLHSGTVPEIDITNTYTLTKEYYENTGVLELKDIKVEGKIYRGAAEDDINDADAVLEEDDVNVVVSKSLKKSAEIEVEAVEDFFE